MAATHAVPTLARTANAGRAMMRMTAAFGPRWTGLDVFMMIYWLGARKRAVVDASNAASSSAWTVIRTDSEPTGS